MIRNLFVCFLTLLEFSLFAQNSFLTGQEIVLKKNEEAICSINSSGQQTCLFTRISSSTTVNNMKAPDKFFIYKFDAGLNQLSREELNFPAYKRSDFQLEKAMSFSGKVLLIGWCTDTRTNTCYTLFTSFDPEQNKYGEYDVLGEYSYTPMSYLAPTTKYCYRLSPSGKALAIEIVYDPQQGASGNRTISLEHRFIVIDEALKARKVYKQPNEEEYYFTNLDFAVTDKGELLICEEKKEHIKPSFDYSDPKSGIEKLLSAKLDYTIKKFSPGKNSAEQSRLRYFSENKYPDCCLFFFSGDEIWLGGILNPYLVQTKDSNDFQCRLFVVQPDFNSGQTTISEANSATISPQMHREILEGNEEDKEGAQSNFVFSSAVKTESGKFILTGEFYSDRTFPPMKVMEKDKRYTVTKSNFGTYSVSGPPEYSRNFRQIFIFSFNPQDGNLSGSSIGRNFKTRQDQNPEQLKRATSLFYCSDRQTFLFLDSNSQGVIINSGKADGTTETCSLKPGPDYRMVPGEGNVFFIYTAKSAYAVKLN